MQRHGGILSTAHAAVAQGRAYGPQPLIRRDRPTTTACSPRLVRGRRVAVFIESCSRRRRRSAGPTAAGCCPCGGVQRPKSSNDLGRSLHASRSLVPLRSMSTTSAKASRRDAGVRSAAHAAVRAPRVRFRAPGAHPALLTERENMKVTDPQEPLSGALLRIPVRHRVPVGDRSYERISPLSTAVLHAQQPRRATAFTRATGAL